MIKIFEAISHLCFLSSLLISMVTALENELDYNDLDTWEAPAKIRERAVYYLSGFDDEDRPIWIAEVGKWDLWLILEDPQMIPLLNKYIRQSHYRFNQSLSLRSTPDKPVTEGILISDMEGYSTKQLTHAKAIKWSLEQAPAAAMIAKRLAKSFFINVNSIAHTFLRLMKPFFGQVSEKTVVYGTNKEIWIPKLLKQLPKESLPPFYGGSDDFKPLRVYG